MRWNIRPLPSQSQLGRSCFQSKQDSVSPGPPVMRLCLACSGWPSVRVSAPLWPEPQAGQALRTKQPHQKLQWPETRSATQDWPGKELYYLLTRVSGACC